MENVYHLVRLGVFEGNVSHPLKSCSSTVSPNSCRKSLKAGVSSLFLNSSSSDTWWDIFLTSVNSIAFQSGHLKLTIKYVWKDMHSASKKPSPDQIFGRWPQIWRCCWPRAHRSSLLAEMPEDRRAGEHRIPQDLYDLVRCRSSPLGRGQDWNADPQFLHTATVAKTKYTIY